jgi:hypothetical protein
MKGALPWLALGAALGLLWTCVIHLLFNPHRKENHVDRNP